MYIILKVYKTDTAYIEKKEGEIEWACDSYVSLNLALLYNPPPRFWPVLSLSDRGTSRVSSLPVPLHA